SKSKRLGSDVTGKLLLTHYDHLVGTADREPDVFAAISHPARRRMLDLLIETARSVNAPAGHFQMSWPAVSQHLRVLLDAGLVTEPAAAAALAQRAGALGYARCANRIGRVEVFFPRRCPNGCSSF